MQSLASSAKRSVGRLIAAGFFSFILISCSSLGGLVSPKEEIRYEVRAGDSLYLIARRFEVSVVELQAKNRIKDPRKLVIGQMLQIPFREGQNSEASGGPYVSAAQAKRQRAHVRVPSKDTIDVQLILPTRGAKLGSRFGYRGSRFHEGLDLVAPQGTPIYAAHDGIVLFSGQKLSGYGKMVALKEGEIMTVYAHTSKNFVERGQRVRKGEKIAEVGSTGRASGPHLHFEVRVRADDGRYYAVEPLDFIR